MDPGVQAEITRSRGPAFISLLCWDVLLAVTATSLLLMLVPQNQMMALLSGNEILCVLLATAIGALFPAGPAVIFAIVAALLESNVSAAVAISFGTAWSIAHVQRIIAYDIVLVGLDLTWRRLLLSLPIAPLIGVVAGAIVDE